MVAAKVESVKKQDIGIGTGFLENSRGGFADRSMVSPNIMAADPYERA